MIQPTCISPCKIFVHHPQWPWQSLQDKALPCTQQWYRFLCWNPLSLAQLVCFLFSLRLHYIVNRGGNNFNQLHIMIIDSCVINVRHSRSSNWSEPYSKFDSSKLLPFSTAFGSRDSLPTFTFDVDCWFTQIFTAFKPSFYKHAFLGHINYVTEKQTGHRFKYVIMHSSPPSLPNRVPGIPCMPS